MTTNRVPKNRPKRKPVTNRPVLRSRPRMDTRQLTREWRKLPPVAPAEQVRAALAAGDDRLTDKAFRLWTSHAENICRDYGLSPEVVADIFGPDFHAAAIVTVYYDTDCFYRTTRAARRFLNRPDIRARLNAWNVIRAAS